MRLDVVVEDTSGNPMTDLGPGDFDILEDGRPRPIVSFAFVDGHRSAEAIRSTLLVAGDPLRSIVILIDDLGIGESAMQQLHTAIGAIEQDMRPGDAVAIVTTSGKPADLPRLSTSTSTIRVTAASIALNPGHRPGVLDAGFCGRADTASSVLRTLSILRRTVDGLRDLPGRKSIIFVSEGFMLGTGEVAAMWKDLLPYANRAAVSISTLDPRGVVPLSGPDMDCRLLRADEFSASRRSLTEIAAATSGVSVAGQDDHAAISRLMQQGSGYYLIAYEPSPWPNGNIAPDPARYHPVSIRIRRPGAVAHYHTSLFESRANDPDARISAALGSPFAVPGIRIAVSSGFWSGFWVDGDSGPILHSAVWIDARDLSLSTESDGSSKVTFDLIAVTLELDESSRPLDNFRQSITVNIPVAFRQTVLGDGLRARLNMGVKNPGAYEVRVAVRDQRSERIGSDAAFVDVPDLARGELALSGILIGTTGHPGAAGEAIPRRFHPGQTIIVGYQILNARRDASGNVRVYETAALLHAGSVVATGDPTVADGKDQPDPARMLREREFLFGEDLEPGTYNLKVTAVDENAPHGNDSVSQSIEVEIN